ncbi:DUF4435 domain-containing protein [Sphingobium sp. AP49]|uniref:DUF4435 domain-containing protein n=1 Tax=Sphingobium sp. AP49 TaxID=1144307 RepID=UPI00026EC920|nr:DUF4435 domain-containing protein [Sphingobium sp. AP49]WHO38206.1 DUF4435 domain-containing protein [Sphingobium sp. AP49]
MCFEWKIWSIKMFERTTAGQQNRALFYGASYTCYVEGGDQDHDRSADSIFWDGVLRKYRPDLKIVFLPRGGKPVVEALARQIIDDDISNAIAAMDRDYDGLLGHEIADSRVLYSHGYSWENDAFSPEFLSSMVKSLARLTTLPATADAALVAGCEKLCSDVQRAIKSDFLALSAGSSVLPRNAPGRVIKADPVTAFPKIDQAELMKLAADANVKTRLRKPRILPQKVFELHHLVGHCFQHAILILVRAMLRNVGVKKAVSIDHFEDLALSSISRHLQDDHAGVIAVHHQAQCSAIP